MTLDPHKAQEEDLQTSRYRAKTGSIACVVQKIGLTSHIEIQYMEKTIFSWSRGPLGFCRIFCQSVSSEDYQVRHAES